MPIVCNLTDSLFISSVEIWPTHNPESRVKAMARIILNDALSISGLKVIEGRNGLFVSWPQEKRPGTDEWFPVARVLTRAVGDKAQEAIIERYQAMLADSLPF